MEKIAGSNLKISLDGPLSRNEQFKNLKVGDEFNAKIISKINRYSAVLDLSGNRVRADFTFPVPESPLIRLQISGSGNGWLNMKMLSVSEDMDAIRSLMNNFPITYGEIAYFALNYIKLHDFSIFRILDDYYKKNSHFREKRKRIKDLKFSTPKSSLLSKAVSMFVINLASGSETGFLSSLFDSLEYFAENEENVEINENSMKNMFPNEIFSDIGKRPSYYFLGSNGNGIENLEVLADGDFFIFRADFSVIGAIELIVSSASGPRMDLFYQKSGTDKNIVDKLNKLTEVISNNVRFFLWEKTEFQMKFTGFLKTESRVDIKA